MKDYARSASVSRARAIADGAAGAAAQLGNRTIRPKEVSNESLK